MSGINIFGDSNVAGSIESWKNDVFPPDISWAGRLSQSFENVRVNGVPGRTLFESISEYEQMQESFPARITIICVGPNDLYYGRTASELFTNLEDAIEQTDGEVIYLRHPGIKYSLQDLQAPHRQQYVDKESDFFGLLKGLKANVVIPPQSTIDSDRWHFDAHGHAIVFEMLENAIIELLVSKSM